MRATRFGGNRRSVGEQAFYDAQDEQLRQMVERLSGHTWADNRAPSDARQPSAVGWAPVTPQQIRSSSVPAKLALTMAALAAMPIVLVGVLHVTSFLALVSAAVFGVVAAGLGVFALVGGRAALSNE
jgi:hypothetical protein